MTTSIKQSLLKNPVVRNFELNSPFKIGMSIIFGALLELALPEASRSRCLKRDVAKITLLNFQSNANGDCVQSPA
ncbi:hypothetical protein NIES2107_45910 [Nostoc carneum NIES-2107]|nr:hypothetical protein NIES2107_45910 [Nostoc carneum NIES-2107]